MIDHLSVSQLDMFSRCGEQWRRRYIEGEVIPPGVAARVGTGVHRAAEVNYKHKIEHGEDMPLDSVKDAAADAYGKALREGVFFAPDEVSGARHAMSAGKDAAVSLATLYRQELAPKVMPALVEEKIILDLPGVPLPIVTILDCYTQTKELRDIKTASRKWDESKAHTSMQPTVYREAVRQVTGEYPECLCFDVLVNTKIPALQVLPTKRDADDLAIMTRKFQIMLASINAGIFQPAEPGSWMCSPKFCGYYYTCNYIPALRKTQPKKAA